MANMLGSFISASEISIFDFAGISGNLLNRNFWITSISKSMHYFSLKGTSAESGDAACVLIPTSETNYSKISPQRWFLYICFAVATCTIIFFSLFVSVYKYCVAKKHKSVKVQPLWIRKDTKRLNKKYWKQTAQHN